MMRNSRVLAVIPARGGSKGLPGKNLRDFAGKPLVAWTIEQARACEGIDTVVVSTDSDAIAEVAVRYGAAVPFMRPPSLASDTASSIDVLLHALDHYASTGEAYDVVVMLEPTSPLRDVSDIAGALAMLGGSDRAASVVGVAKAEGTHPAFLFTTRDGMLVPLTGAQPTDLRRQDLRDDYYYLEGSVYVSRVASLREHRSFYHAATAPWVVERYKAIEVDELCDFIAADALMKAKLQGMLK